MQNEYLVKRESLKKNHKHQKNTLRLTWFTTALAYSFIPDVLPLQERTGREGHLVHVRVWWVMWSTAQVAEQEGGGKRDVRTAAMTFNTSGHLQVPFGLTQMETGEYWWKLRSIAIWPTFQHISILVEKKTIFLHYKVQLPYPLKIRTVFYSTNYYIQTTAWNKTATALLCESNFQSSCQAAKDMNLGGMETQSPCP